ncbi:enoyl-CoA hydratase/isomerase family protein [Sporolactobacillus vineae]|uniref:enoyl-CoA hydratase/isomerase family protein n=1 Tax=Sporolactobacillus vineae TaxID=444463 RepID=UPI0002892BC8|nr:enoyl-CoA hydratase-related protein [Sporolactobacillus vineae]
MGYQYVALKTEAHTALLTMTRPEALNALNTGMLRELEAAFDHLAEEREIRAVIVTGSGERAFIAGADIGEMEGHTPGEAERFSRSGHRLMAKIEQLPQPVIAAVNGYAMGGGCELALACDFRLASRNAQFGQPEVGLGIIPGFGGTQRLPRLIGSGLAKELLFTGRTIPAERAREIGLVNEVYASRAELDVHACQLARMIAGQAPLAVQRLKKLVNDGPEKAFNRALHDETEQFAGLFMTQDQKEGMNAFLKKRKPDFLGK